MAARKRQVQNSEHSNEKTASGKGNIRSKHNLKGRNKDDETSRQRTFGIMYKICLIAAGKYLYFAYSFFSLSLNFDTELESPNN